MLTYFCDFAYFYETNKRGNIVLIETEFQTDVTSKYLMTRGGKFYAFYDESTGFWTTDEKVMIKAHDAAMRKYVAENKERLSDKVVVPQLMSKSSSGTLDQFHKYVKDQIKESFVQLDETLIFSNMKVTRESYASKTLPYALVKGDHKAWDTLMGTLYSPTELHKLEWVTGAIVTGASKKLQKFLALYGAPGSGKSTYINICTKLFEGYIAEADVTSLGSSSNTFATEQFASGPLVMYEHEAKLDNIEDNTKLNSLVAHESIRINAKYQSSYPIVFKGFIIVATNSFIKITDAKSGLIRRLIDAHPTGNILEPEAYWDLMDKINFELGAIAYHCKEVYLKNPHAYDKYVASEMIGATNPMYNFILFPDVYAAFEEQDGTTLQAAWKLYLDYCEFANVKKMQYTMFREELKNYFENFEERAYTKDRIRVRQWYSGFIKDKFMNYIPEEKKDESQTEFKQHTWIEFKEQPSLLDEVLADCKAQYAVFEKDGGDRPAKAWGYVRTLLRALDTRELHYVLVPINHIVIDFDLKDENGEKSLERNLEEANKWPRTYAELSKSGKGIHLHYIYAGDPTQLQNVYQEGIEIKVFVGKSALRRKVTKCNDIPVATISSGLPFKEVKEVIPEKVINDEAHLINLINKALRKDGFAGTKVAVDFIFMILEQAYVSGMHYDVSRMQQAVWTFASRSTNNSEYCKNLVAKMHFKSDLELVGSMRYNDPRLIFFDVEVYKNLFVVVYKPRHEKAVRMINPTPQECEWLLQKKLIGFNCRKYDNHIMYARAYYGYSNMDLYNLSHALVNNDKNAMFNVAKEASYMDLYEVASNRQSLKKYEYEMEAAGILVKHLEISFDWNEPVPEDKWELVAEYCENDVVATEALYDYIQADVVAIEILADLSGLTLNSSKNSHSAKLIFGDDKAPQRQFNWRDLGGSYLNMNLPDGELDDFSVFDDQGRPVFPGYKYTKIEETKTVKGVERKSYRFASIYRGEEVGEGGYVYATPGMYDRTITLDVASMHPSSIIAENLFGDKYTARFKELLDARIAIKHKDFESAKKMFDGKLAKWLEDPKMAKALSNALKIVINSVYGLTAAKFDNKFKDPKNIDNIVAKRGALFMVNLKHEVMKKGFTVVHIKTDSIKIANPTQDIIDFVVDYGKMYGYNFEIEHIFDRICLVNDAVYIAKCAADDPETPEQWTATGTEFQRPYIFKSLFSHEELTFNDLCETKQVTTSLYLDYNENLAPGFHEYEFVGRIGQFVPVRQGTGGAELLRKKDESYSAVGGTKGWRWKEASKVRLMNSMDEIDFEYYDSLARDAVAHISEFGDFEQFAA